MDKAIFLDRDGTINDDLGHIRSPNELVFIPQSLEAMKILQKEFVLFIVTNQPGIGKGIFTAEDFMDLNNYFIDFLRERDIEIRKVYYCPHTEDDNCVCRKPNPYFLRMAERDYHIDLKRSYVVGDHPHDIEMASRVGAGSVYLLTGHGGRHTGELRCKPDFVARNLYEAAIWIMQNEKKEKRQCR